jgi:Holliday junction DNA helicase RuvA
MIAHLRGKLLEKQPTRLVVEVGGVGLEVSVPVPTVQATGKVGDMVSLHTVLVVREDALTLYGFSEASERALFLKLLTVSGIGPKLALGALSGPSVPELVAAIREGNLAVLTRLNGIGKKTAERMSVELRDNLLEFEAAQATGAPSVARNDAVGALVSLGYNRAAAAAVVDEILRGGKVDAAEDLVRRALARLSQR